MSGSTCEIDRLPEACVSHVLSFTSPRDSCRATVASRTFRLAADSDTVWSRFLPPSYREILSRTVDSVSFSSCKELYFKLCDSVPIDGGTKVFSLEKATGAKCFALGSKELHIQQVDGHLDWRWVSHPTSRFTEVAEVWYTDSLEVQCYIDCKELSPNTTYKSYLVFKTSEDALGLMFSEEVSVKLGSQISKGKACLDPNGSELNIFRNRRRRELPPDMHVPRFRSDGWMELELGEFYNKDGSDGDVSMSFKHASSVWRRSLIIEGVEVRPK